LEKGFDECILTRCEEVLLKNKDYNELQRKLSEAYKENDIDEYCELTMKIQIIIERTCYKLAAKDTVMFLYKD
jgi:hypothetical protein